MSDRDIRQHQCIEKWVHNKCKGCIEGCTGFGKTRVALNAISMIHKKYPNLRILVVVPTSKTMESSTRGKNVTRRN